MTGRRVPGPARLAALAVLPLALAAGGCQAPYLLRQAAGAIGVLRGRVPIDDALRARLPPERREKLAWVERVRAFAESEIGLDVGDAYTAYYDTGDEPISVMLVAANPLALIPYRWHFPIAGTVPYKGFFDPGEATAERNRLRAAGWDADVIPVAAFSSLGWFGDPVLSTMLDLPRGQLADLLIHELTHRTVYFPGESAANEGLAMTVAREGTEELLRRDFGEGSAELAEYRSGEDRGDLRDAVLRRLRADLDALYRSRLDDGEKRARKAALFAGASRALEEAGLRGGLEPSNAPLVIEKEYRDATPFLREATGALGGRPRDLVAAMKELRGSRYPLVALAARIEARRGDGRAAAGGGDRT